MEGKILGGRYQLLQLIGSGGMASVYEAVDRLLDRPVAVKILNVGLSQEEMFIQRFIHEARAVAKLSHPNIVNMHDVGQEGSIYYMVMELVEGETLKEMIAREGALPPEEAVSIAIQLCDGLAHAHDHHIIHRDIKPHNILSNYDGRFKLADFGIARSLRAADGMTRTGTVLGSVHYFSPEQARGTELSYTSDIYSLGVVLYEMVTGEVLFDGEESITIALKHIQEPVPDPRQWNPNIPDTLVAVIETALQKDPHHRYQTAYQMRQALEYVLHSMRNQPVRRTTTNPHGYTAYDANAYKTHPQTTYASNAYEEVPSRQEHLEKQPRKKNRKALIIILSVLFLIIALFVINKLGHHKPKSLQQPAQQNPVSTPIVTPTPNPTPLPANPPYPWWKENNVYRENHFFHNHFVTGKDGEYDVTLDASKDIPGATFYYTVVVIDAYGARPIPTLENMPVSFKPATDQPYTPVSFHISVRKDQIPTAGILRLRIFFLNPKNGKPEGMVPNQLERFGTAPQQ